MGSPGVPVVVERVRRHHTCGRWGGGGDRGQRRQGQQGAVGALAGARPVREDGPVVLGCAPAVVLRVVSAPGSRGARGISGIWTLLDAIAAFHAGCLGQWLVGGYVASVGVEN